MATVNKDFRIKNGLVVEGATATVNGSTVLTEASTEFLQDTVGAMVNGSTQTNITVTYDDATGKLNFVAENGVADSTTSDLVEGTNLYFTNERVDDRVSDLLIDGTGLDKSYNDTAGTLTLSIDSTVTTNSGTQTLTNKTINLANNTITGTKAQFNAAMTDADFATLAGTETLSGKTIPLGINSISGTLAQFNTALTDADFVSLAGPETLTNKTLVSPTININSLGSLLSAKTSAQLGGNYARMGDNLNIFPTPIWTDLQTATLLVITGAGNSNGTYSKVSSDALGFSSWYIASNPLFTYSDLSSATFSLYTTATTVISSTEISYLDGVTSSIQTQLDDKSTASKTETFSNKTLGSSITFGANLNANNYKITNMATPTSSGDAANKAYVDAVTEGLHIHASAVAATTTNISISANLEAGDVLDGVTLVAGDRVLVKNQNTASENGIYVVQASGAAVRATDFDQPAEVDGGDFIFVTGGTVNDNTGWVQTSTGVVTIGTDPIYFTQFSGAGTYLAGNGLTLTGNTFAIDTLITTDLNSIQTLTNKTLTSPVITTPSVSGLYLSDSSIVFEGTTNDYETTLQVTDPTADRTITLPDVSGTVVTTGDTGTVTSTMIADGTIVNDDISASAAIVDTKLDTISTADKVSISALNIDGGTDIGADLADADLMIIDDGGAGTNRKSAVTRIPKYVFSKISGDVTIDSNGVATVNNNTVVLGTDTTGNYIATIAGTTNQISVTGSGTEDAAVTLSLPQNIDSGATPTFAGINLGSVTLTDALIGTAVTNITGTSATVVDSWSATSYNSAKYIVQMKKSTDIQVLEVLVTIDGNNNVYLTEYADVISNVSIGTTDADYSGGNVRLLVTASSDTTVKIHKTLIEA